MKLCIAEKPSVAKDIAKVLGATTMKNGYWEGNGYWVSWTFGHLCTLKEPADYTDKWKWWDLETLPMLPSKFGIKLIQNSGVEKQFNAIADLVAKCDEVINCGDAGQEGELIQRWVLAKAKLNKPLKRLWISSLTEEAIKEGFQKLEEGSKYDNLYAAGAARAIGDWVLGVNATRLVTLRFADKKKGLSLGGVQTPTLALIVERQIQIDNFVSETYYELKTTYRDVVFSSTKGKFNSKEEGEGILKEIDTEEFEIEAFAQKEGKEQPPRLFDLTSLQVDCNRKFGFSAEETLNLIQNLYEQKLTTYPRVDTTYLSEDIYPKVPGILDKLQFYKRFTDKLKGKKIRKSKKVFDDKKVTDHHAIIPTGVTPSGISAQHQKVYDMITKRFISVFYPDCKVSNSTVLGFVKEVKFKATGKQILEMGWREVYADTSPKEQAKEPQKEEQVMPVFVKGEKGPHTPDFQEKHTKPPSYYSEATLLRAMESAGKQVDDDELRDIMKENGIGRPSTRANIIETLFKRNYIARQKKRIIATQTGQHLISLIENDILKSAELTGQWEKKIRDIERGEYAVEKFKAELFDMVNELVHQVKHQKAEPKKIGCPKCSKGHMIRGRSAWGCSEWESGCKFTLPFKFKEITFSDKDMKSLIEEGESYYRFKLILNKKEELVKVTLNKKLKLGW